MSNNRGLLASPNLDGEPVKAIYFFAGESAGNLFLYTTHPLLDDDRSWNSDPSSRGRVMDRIVAAHANTIAMSYWSDMPQWSPMALDGTSVFGVLDAVQGRPLVILPVIEGGIDSTHPDTPQWEFATDFPEQIPGGPTSPGLIERIGWLADIFAGRMHLWAQMYDQDNQPRYAVQVLHVCSALPGTTDASFAQGFAHVAGEVLSRYAIKVGFTLDIIGSKVGYVATPADAGPWLEREPAVLAVNGFESEVFSGKIMNGPPGGPPIDNNIANLPELADWKRAALRNWIATGIPVIADVSNGMDGRLVWRQQGSGFWGDNFEYTDDRWRNWMSELKGMGNSGIAFDTWNGFTEGYAAVPSFEHGDTVYRWLTDLLEPDPRDFSHMHYVKGVATYRVYGAICEKWISLGADRGFGFPTSGEESSGGGRVSYFNDGQADKAIYWSSATAAHEVHGLIAQTYWDSGGAAGPLGLPTTDQTLNGGSQVSQFEHGFISWSAGDTSGTITLT
jgi:hypothetical protein